MAMGIGTGYADYGNTAATYSSVTNHNNSVKHGSVADGKNLAAAGGKAAGTGDGDFYGYLLKKYSCVRDGSVVISEEYLKECEKNPEKARELEENLSFFKSSRETGYRSALTNANALGARVVNYSESWSIDHTGNVTMVANTTVTSGDAAGAKKAVTVSGQRAEKNAKKDAKTSTKEAVAGKNAEKAAKTGTKEATVHGQRAGENAEPNPRKTAADEVAYLAKKYKNCSFAAVNFKPGMRHGTLDTTNIAISPDFLKRMANDPELEREYESYFEEMQRLDAENISSHAARGRRIVAQGWAIDRNGGISRWGISEPTEKRNHMQEMTEYVNKIREAGTAKRKEAEKQAAKQEAKRQSARQQVVKQETAKQEARQQVVKQETARQEARQQAKIAEKRKTEIKEGEKKGSGFDFMV